VIYLLFSLGSEMVPPSVVRIGFMAVVTFHYFVVLLCVGPFAGVEAFVVCLGAIPLLMFAKSERLLLLVSYLMIVTGVAAAAFLASIRPPVLMLDPSVLRAAYFGNIATVAVVMAFLLYTYSRSSIANYLKLQKERLKSERMLFELVPAEVAERLIRGEKIPAQSHGECTVLFADLVHFSDLAENLSPVHLVELLNGIFSEIDDLCETHGVEKIKTIGDCYMCATGIFPEQNRIAEVALVGLGIVRIIDDWAAKTGYPLSVRVGISTGQVISGVIGTKRPLFDIWGQTVNLAQLMEARCDSNNILVAESTQWRLRGRFDFEAVPNLTSKSGHPVSAYRLLNLLPTSATLP
jgi:class 3 adenylate cyclase